MTESWDPLAVADIGAGGPLENKKKTNKQTKEQETMEVSVVSVKN